MFNQYFEYINTKAKDLKNFTIFAHGLGKFDEIFLFRYLSNFVTDINNLKLIIDHHRKFIIIT